MNLGPVTPPKRQCFEVGHHELMLVWVEGRSVLTDVACPHKGAPLDAAPIEEGCIHCPMHEAAFHVETGTGSEPWAGRLHLYRHEIVAGELHLLEALTDD